MERNVLVIAPHIEVRKRLRDALRNQGWQVTLCGNGAEALALCESISCDLVLVDPQITDTTPGKLRDGILSRRPNCQVLTVANFPRVAHTPDALKFGPDHFIIRQGQLVELLGDGGASEGSGIPTFEQIGSQALIQTIDVLVGLLELDERFFSGNSHRVAWLSKAVARKLVDETHGVEAVQLAAMLRDIGRAGLPDPVLDESGELNADQQAAMQSHVQTSMRLLDGIEFPWKLLPIIRHHHERYDGSGYPDGLRGREIPLGARILSAVDAYVAMTSPRSHRGAKSPDDALSELMREAGHHFDPEVVEALQTVLAEHLELHGEASKPSVLLVDDDRRFLRLFRQELTREGFEILHAPNSGEALRLLLDRRPQAVAHDVDRDPDAAFAFLDEMRGSRDLGNVPVLFVTKGNDRALRLRAFRAGIDDLLVKDDSLEELCARVHNVLVRESIRQDGTVLRQRKGISGTLENLALPDLVQMLVVGMKTASVTLETSERKGRIWFDTGALVGAETGEARGEDAFYEMVTWAQGEFLIEHGVRSKRPNLQGDAMFLLMEGLRRLDESTDTQAVS